MMKLFKRVELGQEIILTRDEVLHFHCSCGIFKSSPSLNYYSCHRRKGPPFANKFWAPHKHKKTNTLLTFFELLKGCHRG